MRNGVLIISPWQPLGYRLFFIFLFVFFEQILNGFKEKIGEGSILFDSKKFESFNNSWFNSECDVFLFHTALIKYIKTVCNKKT
jgi:hypothetical protein